MKVKAWAVVDKTKLTAIGNGGAGNAAQFQFPIFPTRAEARSYRDISNPIVCEGYRIIRVLITELKAKKGGRK